MLNIQLPMLQYKEIVTAIADILVLLLAAFFVAFFKQIKQWLMARKSKNFDLAINRNYQINALLSELRVIYLAERVLFFQLHNGEYFLSGESNMKCSMTHFVVGTGVAAPFGSIYQNVPTTHLVETFTDLKNEGFCWYEVDSESPQDPSLRHLLALTGTVKALIAPVRKGANVWMGFVAVAWMDEVSQQEIEALEEYAQKIADILNVPS